MAPVASVVIPTYNKATFLRLTLTSLATQRFRDFELIVVDDGSTDETPHVIDDLSSSLPLVKYVRQSNEGRSRARNRAIAIAEGDVILFTEDDYIMRPDFVSHHVSCHSSGSFTAVVGGIGYRIVTHLPPPDLFSATEYHFLRDDAEFAARLNRLESHQLESWPLMVTVDDVLTRFDWLESLAIPLELVSQLEWAEQRYGQHFQGFYLPWLFFGGGNVSVSRATLSRAGGFEESFRGWGSEDLELGYRLYKLGVRFVINRNTQSMHQIHFRPTDDIRLQSRKNHARFCELHPDYEILLFYLYNPLRYAGFLDNPITISEYNDRVAAYRSSPPESQSLLLAELRRTLAENGVFPDVRQVN